MGSRRKRGLRRRGYRISVGYISVEEGKKRGKRENQQ